MPNRIIKETIRTSKTLNMLSDFEFRLWTYLLTYVDDFGRGSADPVLLKGFVLPRSAATIDEIHSALYSLEDLGMIERYEVEGEPFFLFPNWAKHQRVQCKKAKFPPPSEKENDDLRCSTVSPEEERGNLRCSTVSCGEIADFTERRGVPPCSTVTHGDSPWITVSQHAESESEYKSESLSEEKERVNREKKPPSSAFAPERTVFVAPSVEEVRAYIESRGSGIDAERFVSYYETTGWRIGGNRKMKDWRAAVRLWEKRDEERARERSAKSAKSEKSPKERQGNFDAEEAFRIALARTYGGEK